MAAANPSCDTLGNLFIITLICIMCSKQRMHIYQETVVDAVVCCPDSTVKNKTPIPPLPGVLATDGSQLSPSPGIGRKALSLEAAHIQ